MLPVWSKELVCSQVSQELGRMGWDKNQEWSQKIQRDVLYHLQHLEEAELNNTERLFVDYCLWSQEALVRVGLPFSCLSQTLEAIMATPSIASDTTAMGILTTASKAVARFEPADYTHSSGPYAAYLSSLVHYQRDAAMNAIQELRAQGYSIQRVYKEIFSPTLREIGTMWHKGLITVAHEHYATAVTQHIMGNFSAEIFRGPKNGLKFIGACGQGELHEIGLRMVCDLLELEGWDTIFLGANTPLKSLLATIRDTTPNCLGLSAALIAHLGAIRETVAAVKAEFSALPIVVGGAAFVFDADLWKSTGASMQLSSLDDIAKELQLLCARSEL